MLRSFKAEKQKIKCLFEFITAVPCTKKHIKLSYHKKEKLVVQCKIICFYGNVPMGKSSEICGLVLWHYCK